MTLRHVTAVAATATCISRSAITELLPEPPEPLAPYFAGHPIVKIDRSGSFT
jgi:hypothetical protein